ncbi:MAG: YbjN domain-containing protein [Alphaproteobacteria bacterium]
MRLLRVALVGACALVISAFGATASASYDAAKVVTSFDAREILAIATSLGFKAELTPAKAGGSFVTIQGNGVQFAAIPTACKTPGQGCVGLELQMNAGKAPQLTYEQVNQFNLDWVFTQAYILNGEARISRYEICDHGIGLGNVATNIGQFAAIAAKFRETVDRAAKRS